MIDDEITVHGSANPTWMAEKNNVEHLQVSHLPETCQAFNEQWQKLQKKPLMYRDSN
jgi:hypothetical protein